MSFLVVWLLAMSSGMHAGWNLITRGHGAKLALTGQTYIIFIFAALPLLAWELAAPGFTRTAWLCVAGSGFCVGLYSYSLARAYETADLTTAYPVVRSLPVLLLGFFDIGRGHHVSAAAWLGMALVAAGCFLTPLPSLRDFHWRRYFSKATVWMVLTALGTVGYSLLDKIAVETLPRTAAVTVRYCGMFYLFGGLWLIAALRWRAPGWYRTDKVRWRGPAAIVLLNFGAYWLVILAYQLTDQVSYVVAFRQMSILIGVVFGFLIFKEPGLRIRLSGALLITAGLVIVALGG